MSQLEPLLDDLGLVIEVDATFVEGIENHLLNRKNGDSLQK